MVAKVWLFCKQHYSQYFRSILFFLISCLCNTHDICATIAVMFILDDEEINIIYCMIDCHCHLLLFVRHVILTYENDVNQSTKRVVSPSHEIAFQ